MLSLGCIFYHFSHPILSKYPVFLPYSLSLPLTLNLPTKLFSLIAHGGGRGVSGPFKHLKMPLRIYVLKMGIYLLNLRYLKGIPFYVSYFQQFLK